MTGRSVWRFDGEDGRSEILKALVERQLESLEPLLPEQFDDPMDQLAAELAGGGQARVSSDPVLARLFPPALQDAEEADTFRRDALTSQAAARISAGRRVLADVDANEDEVVLVAADGIDAWVMTLAGLRAQWTVELTGSQERLVQPTFRDTMRNPTAAAVTDWLGFLIEDALEARSVGAEEE